MEGRAWVFGDDIDTDIMFPNRFSPDPTPEEMAKHVFYDFRPEFAREAKPGDIVVAGRNFGYGSYRESPAFGMRALGIQAVIARSFARAFYRNASNSGLWLITLGDAEFHCEDGDRLEVDPRSGAITNKTTGKNVRGTPFAGIAREIVEAGGATRYFKSKVLYPEAKQG
jgi:3-isopropylmalate/(R)-2-methylmalate dehydratase small subunit